MNIKYATRVDKEKVLISDVKPILNNGVWEWHNNTGFSFCVWDFPEITTENSPRIFEEITKEKYESIKGEKCIHINFKEYFKLIH